ncbi:hypothetical protein AAH994_08140 [Weeksellaceae bacterium A-14]|uniref:hypothetical protein n=1 Tax=Daejeonia sp. YH14 TaxID=3439042 RepID=UPI0031E4DEA6
MKKSNLKGALGALAVVGIALIAKKACARKKAFRNLLEEYGIQEKSPFGIADKIRELDDEQYAALKEKLQKQFQNRCCRHCEA